MTPAVIRRVISAVIGEVSGMVISRSCWALETAGRYYHFAR
jgi:hypothetical protein